MRASPHSLCGTSSRRLSRQNRQPCAHRFPPQCRSFLSRNWSCEMDTLLPFKALIVASRAKDHLQMITSAEPFFNRMASENRFAVDFTADAETINEQNLEQYRVFVMLHLAPFDMTY